MLKNLRQLSIEGTEINDNSMDQLTSKSNALPELELISLRNNQKLTSKTLNILLGSRRNIPKLSKMFLDNCPSFEIPNKILINLSTSISITGCSLVGAKELSDFIKLNTLLTYIKFDAALINVEISTSIN